MNTAKDITITLTEEEQRSLTQLLDIAIKAAGLQVARAAMHFALKIATEAQRLEENRQGGQPS